MRHAFHLLIVATIAAAALSFQAPAASAHGSGVPWHALPNAECGYGSTGGVVKAFTPGRVGTYYADWEKVYWRADLYRYYDGYGWFKFRSSPWLTAVGNYYGLASGIWGQWRDYSTNVAYISWNFTSLPAGDYFVHEVLEWDFSTDLRHGESVLMNGAGSCRL